MSNHSLFTQANWYQAITLSERVGYLDINKHEALYEINQAHVNKQMQRWQAKRPFTNPTNFNQRLASEKITEREFRYLLGESAEMIHQRWPHAPAWLIQLQNAFAQFNKPVLAFHTHAANHGAIHFLHLIEPLIGQGMAKLQQGIRQLDTPSRNAPFDPTTIEKNFIQ